MPIRQTNGYQACKQNQGNGFSLHIVKARKVSLYKMTNEERQEMIN